MPSQASTSRGRRASPRRRFGNQAMQRLARNGQRAQRRRTKNHQRGVIESSLKAGRCCGHVVDRGHRQYLYAGADGPVRDVILSATRSCRRQRLSIVVEPLRTPDSRSAELGIEDGDGRKINGMPPRNNSLPAGRYRVCAFDHGVRGIDRTARPCVPPALRPRRCLPARLGRPAKRALPG